MDVHLDDIFVAMIWHKPLELGAVEVAKELGDIVKTNIDGEKLVKIMCRQ